MVAFLARNQKSGSKSVEQQKEFTMRKTFFLQALVIIGAGMFLSACIGGSSTSTGTTESGSTTVGAPAANQKSGDTIKTGIITEAGSSFFLTEPGDTPRVIESYSVDLSQYVGQTVTVTGQYSGDTLFIGKVD